MWEKATRVTFSRVGWFSHMLAFRSFYYPWGKMGTTHRLKQTYLRNLSTGGLDSTKADLVGFQVRKWIQQLNNNEILICFEMICFLQVMAIINDPAATGIYWDNSLSGDIVDIFSYSSMCNWAWCHKYHFHKWGECMVLTVYNYT